VFLLASWEEAPQCLASSSPGYLQLTAATRDLALLLSGPKEGLAFRFALPVIAPLMFRPSITVSAGMEVLAWSVGRRDFIVSMLYYYQFFRSARKIQSRAVRIVKSVDESIRDIVSRILFG
jgi:hypothetical protein